MLDVQTVVSVHMNNRGDSFHNYIRLMVKAAADRYSARPDIAEHQTGLVTNLTDNGSGNLFVVNTMILSLSIKNNAHNYDFTQVRFKAGKAFCSSS